MNLEIVPTKTMARNNKGKNQIKILNKVTLLKCKSNKSTILLEWTLETLKIIRKSYISEKKRVKSPKNYLEIL